MKFKIMDRYKVSEYKNHLQRYAVISITSPYNEYPLLNEGYVDVLRMKFVDADVALSLFDEKELFSDDNAKSVLDFVELNKDKVDLFVVNCNAGISRSAATAAALSKIYNGNDMYIFNDWRYYPNMRVYSFILKEANKRGLI